MPLTKIQLVQRIVSLKKAFSYKQGKMYLLYGIQENRILFKREDNLQKPPEKLPVEELWQIYTNLDTIDTQNVQQYVKGRMYSPACAILIDSGIYSPQGVRQL